MGVIDGVWQDERRAVDKPGAYGTTAGKTEDVGMEGCGSLCCPAGYSG
jgi:hypothetical protein